MSAPERARWPKEGPSAPTRHIRTGGEPSLCAAGAAAAVSGSTTLCGRGRPVGAACGGGAVSGVRMSEPTVVIIESVTNAGLSASSAAAGAAVALGVLAHLCRDSVAHEAAAAKKRTCEEQEGRQMPVRGTLRRSGYAAGRKVEAQMLVTRSERRGGWGGRS